GLHWTGQASVDMRSTDGQRISPGPFGTPTVWFENDDWYLMYERGDLGVWLAKSSDIKIWTHVQDKPVLEPGPGDYDKYRIAVNQVIKYQGSYYAFYHGSGAESAPRPWAPTLGGAL